MNVHFIAIGGAAMHNLALALHNKGYNVIGRDDEIFNPSKSRLEGEIVVIVNPLLIVLVKASAIV